MKFKQLHPTEEKWYVFDDIYVDVSHAFGMFDVFEDIYYDMLNDMSDDIWWYLKIADIFDDYLIDDDVWYFSKL